MPGSGLSLWVLLFAFFGGISAFQIHNRAPRTSEIRISYLAGREMPCFFTCQKPSFSCSFRRQVSLYMSDAKGSSPSASDSASPVKKKKKKRRRPQNANAKKKPNRKPPKNPSAVQTWRIFGVEVDPDSLGDDSVSAKKIKDAPTVPVEQIYLSQPVLDSLLKRLRIKGEANFKDGELSLPVELKDVRVIRRSLDARKKKILREGPRYTYVIDVDITAQAAMKSRLINQPGRNELFTTDMEGPLAEDDNEAKNSEKKVVIIVGSGPAGLFCARSLALSGEVTPILLERGQAVESRGKDIGQLIHRKTINTESNFAFGEGGAGTWSDGKLTTRIGRNSKDVRTVLETFVSHGAPEKILVDGAPHLGTDNLVKLLRSMRSDLRALGGHVIFGAKMVNIIDDDEKVIGVEVKYSDSIERGVDPDTREIREVGSTEKIYGDAVVLATGHSARDVYESLHRSGIKLEPKGFATGFRVEHPQRIINKIQYGDEWGRNAYTGKSLTDDVNKAFFASEDATDAHDGRLPVPSYRLATDKAFDGKSTRGAYSFCMCPGGQIVPASTEAEEVCVNGMSFSRRDSVWANAALVVTVSPDDPVLEKYREEHGVLAGIAFQRDMERRAAVMGGGNFTVPVQRLTDFVNEVTSTSAPSSSYRLGVKPSPCHEIYPKELTTSLQDAVQNYFDKQMPGFLCEDALLHAVETRTSSPVRISRDPDTMQAIGKRGLYPSGEGAGFAGGIVSAAVDGLVVADSILDDLSNSSSKKRRSKTKSVGYEY